ncbi:MAG: Tetratricopeptide 2 repeat protein [Ramlibacter sp.]|jgi:Flp pilus assembly protein TadD|uniref:tetratricopeptide repeat protein n=1 Tax=Ramlibacter sp. TaxID=1917967 RepID=UPI0026193E5C|nr:tetratricopeptide repeat protein [Ramlibacter sp.]MDB5752968.1 Tetratricopeptide 2 repeat protein [Ramlibacter sp.]
MNQPASSAESGVAERLAGYLRQDPHNPGLLADACDAALAAGLHALAQEHMDTAASLALEPVAWSLRRARMCIAQRRLDEAAGVLQALQATQGAHPALAHDLAYVRLLQGATQACRELLAPWLATDATLLEPQTLEGLQVLWLRATHRLQLLEEAWHWARQQLAQGRLQAAACGVASLVALDTSRFDDARMLSEYALGERPAQIEALVARAGVALADRDTARAVLLLERALQCNPEDGRTWSALGLCSLQAQQLPQAQARFERALRGLPGHVGTWHALGWCRLLQQDSAGALAAFHQALELDRNFAESHGAVGLALVLAGDQAQAEPYLELARRLDPANLTGRYARALLAGETRDVQRLLALADRLLDRPGFGRGRLSESVRSAVGPLGK